MASNTTSSSSSAGPRTEKAPTGGTKKNPSYEEVSAGETGHAESVQVRYDPKKVTYEKLLDAYWHNVDPVTAKIMRDLGGNPPAAEFGKETILGQEFDSSKPDEYLKSVRKPA